MKYLLLLFLLTCIFNTPLLAVSTETENNELVQSAKAEAQRDAKKDVIVKTARRDAEANISKRWALGCLAPYTCMAIGALPGLSSDDRFLFLMGATIGCLTPLALTLNYTHNNKPVPNPEALIGKSPEYVAIYTEAYQKRSNFLKRAPVITGTAAVVAGCVLLLLSLATG